MAAYASSASKKRVVLGVTGGVAAYKAAELARLLTQGGIDVQTVMTQAACRFVGLVTFQSLTGNPVYTDLWDANALHDMAHINLSRDADMILAAPASADFIAKLAHGMADDLLTTLCLARDCPLMVAPAMNRQMWENPATQRNLSLLRQDGITI
ncbi:MAG: phosphopantothenate synthase, partial [Nitrosomonas sp.]|uniref:flavoprotein n=1 Tax=Nitrosomonas sp. TaxID=42353 RepID=UPI0025E6CDA4